jgi:CRP-like cAMP-binding protein
MIEKLLMKLRLRNDLSAEEEDALRALPLASKRLAKRSTLVRRGDLIDESTLLLEGLVCRYKDLRNGSRQISEIHLAGDFVDLHSFTLKRLDHSIMAFTDCVVAPVPHERLKALTERYPHLARVLWFSTNLDAAIHREWMLSLGRRAAFSRLAQFFCELYIRFDIVGLADPDGFAFDLTQTDVAECMGLTPVHVNRTLRTLREQGLADFRAGRVTIGNLAELKRVAEFDETYLYLEKLPR